MTPDLDATRAGFSRFLGSKPDRLHVAAHSHHPWPDVSFEAQQRAWLDAAELIDQKWDRVLGEVIPHALAHVARQLSLPGTDSLAVAPNTHEFLLRLLSCIERPVPRILTTDGEFHSFSRQIARLEEAGRVIVERVPVAPWEDFEDRLAVAAAAFEGELFYFSQCFFNSGYAIEDLARIVRAVPLAETLVVIDGYHGFMARPTDLSAVAGRAFYLAGGYKYAMAGEGCCFLHCPDGHGERPVNTGWYAGFGELSARPSGVPYARGGARFLGATFDPSGWYRFGAVQDWLQATGWSVPAIHEHVAALQARLLAALDATAQRALTSATLLPPPGITRGHFLTFESDRAADLHQRFLAQKVITDYRGDRLRIGLGIYHRDRDIDELAARIEAALADE